MKTWLLGIGTFSIILFADEAKPPQFLEFTKGCFQVNTYFREDGRAHTFASFPEWVGVKQDNDQWIETHYDSQSGDPHWAMRWKQLENKDWEMKHTAGDDAKALYQCTAPVSEIALKPNGERIYVRRCEAKGSPLPMREIRRKRTDYKTLDRVHVTRFSANATSDVQRNTKVKADGSALATEEGWVEYVRLKDNDCKHRPE